MGIIFKELWLRHSQTFIIKSNFHKSYSTFLLFYIYSITTLRTINRNIFPKDFFAEPEHEEEEDSNKNIPKEHPRLLNPAQTIKIVPSKINEIKEIKEEAIEESIDTSQIKKPNLKLIIPDNSNDELEPSTSGSKLSQNTPSNSPLVFIEKNKNKENGKFFSLNKNDDNILLDEEIFKETPHFTGDNKTSCESAKGQIDNNLKLENAKKVKMPLTGNNKGFTGYKFTFNFETKENGVIVPKFNKNEKKILKITNQFRIANNKNGKPINNRSKTKYINKQDSSNKIFSTKDVKCKKNENDNSPLNTSINSIKYINQESPLKPIKNRQRMFNMKDNNKILNDNFNTEINSSKRCNIFDTKKRIRTSRPKSGKNISPKKQSLSKNRIIDSERIKKERKKKCVSSNKRNTILPYLPGNKQIIVKSKLENEVSNLFKMLPDNYYEDPEISNHMNLLIHNIAELKECINKNNKLPFQNNNNVININKK